MAWPLPNDYHTAVQNPRNCFADPELRAGKAVLDPLGLPRLSSGNFAVVFELAQSSRRHAVKCFTREVADLQARYATIAAYLSGRPLPCLVEFAYLPAGIRVQGTGYPLLKMEWVDGELLHQYVERRRGQPAALRALSEAWRGVVADLARLGIAHGDLQHRNILVAADRLRLVDYDGMYVPALRGKAPEERGNDHFQHPGRAKADYGPTLDRFAALSIYLSLRAVAAEPALWDDFHSGENLILSRADYAAPGTTPAWRRLAASPDAEVRALAAALERGCRGRVADVPALEAALPAPRPRADMAAADWQKLAAALGLSPSRGAGASKTAPRPRKPAVAGPSALRCPEGHTVRAPSFLRYCPQCLAVGRRTALYGWRSAPCGHVIPDRANYCPECRAPTGW